MHTHEFDGTTPATHDHRVHRDRLRTAVPFPMDLAPTDLSR
ncbi:MULTISPECIES: hypothetical protein [unclassified Streptomyces]|nr:hypothetical protein [Streptomyces sp. M92]